MKYYQTSWGYHFSQGAHCYLFSNHGSENYFDFISGQNIPTKWNYVTEVQTRIYFISGQNIPTKWNYVTEVQTRIYFINGQNIPTKGNYVSEVQTKIHSSRIFRRQTE